MTPRLEDSRGWFEDWKKFFAITALLIAVGLSGCDNNNDKADAFGTFEVDETVVSSEATGELLSFVIEEGMAFPADSVVGFIDTTSLNLQRAEIHAALLSASTKRRSTSAQIEVTKREREQLAKERDRTQAMYKQKAATQKQLDEITTALDLSTKRLDVLETQFPAIDAEVSSINARRAILEQRIRDAVIVNPISGIVLAKLVNQHELITPGKPLYTIADMSALNLKAFVSETQLSELKLGQKVRVYNDVRDGEMKEHEGTIVWISNKAEFTPKSVQTREERVALVYAIKVKVVNSGDLQIGMPAEVRWR